MSKSIVQPGPDLETIHTSHSLTHADVLKQTIYTSLFDYKIAFYKLVSDLPPGSSMLLYGADYGEFLNYSLTVQYIKKNYITLFIVDDSYSSVEFAHRIVYTERLTDLISIKKMDLSSIEEQFDYVLFLGMFSMLESQKMKNLIEHCKTITKKQILLIHHIQSNDTKKYNTFAKYMKPKLKMGSLTTFSQMVQTIQSWGFENNYIIKLLFDQKCKDYFWYTRYIPSDTLQNIHFTQYLVKIEM